MNPLRIFRLVAVLTACGAEAIRAQEIQFDIRRVPVGHGTSDVVVSDLDGDGNLDVAVSGGGEVTVLLGDGTGALQIHERVEAGLRPVDMSLGDLDGDGHLDMAVANHEMTYVTLLLQGPAGFASGRRRQVPIDVSPHPHAVTLADVDEDGHLDLLVDDRDRQRLWVGRGTGNGGLQPARPVAVDGDPYRGMAVADVNGDGHLDVVTPNSRQVAIQLGDGKGTFTSGPRLPSGDMPPFSVAVADIDADGTADVVAGSGERRGALRVWLGGPGGTFTETASSPFSIAEGPTALSTADVNGDGVTDILATSYVGNGLSLLLGGEEIGLDRIELDDNPWHVAAGDLNGDGRMDLVTANDGGLDITVLLGGPAR